MNCPDNSQDDPRAPYNQGYDQGPVMEDCPRCKGRGRLPMDCGHGITVIVDCDKCDGTGEVNAH